MVRRIRVPLLVLQGTRDDAIRPQQGPALERAAASREKRLVPIAGAKHRPLSFGAANRLEVAGRGLCEQVVVAVPGGVECGRRVI
jgi:alpha-beta hydrolase superfamily lysophospholipase